MANIRRSAAEEIAVCISTGDLEKITEIERERPAEAVDIRVIMSTDNVGAVNLMCDVSALKIEAPWLTSFFRGPKLFFFTTFICECSPHWW
jgi:hypothetical protein